MEVVWQLLSATSVKRLKDNNSPPTHQPTYPHQDLRIEGMKIAHVTHAHRHREVLQHEKTDTAREREREKMCMLSLLVVGNKDSTSME